MTNVLILAAGNVDFDTQDGSYPLYLIELDGKPLLERLIGACQDAGAKQFIVAFLESQVRQYHLKNVVTSLVPNASILGISKATMGAACTALLATSIIDSDQELLILNANEFLDQDFKIVLENFRARGLDAGIVTFPSVHPRYSYVRLGADELVVETAEKNPISRFATAGFYWFSRGRDFVRAAKNMIRKDAAVNGLFYICPALNEMVLAQARIGVFNVDSHQYHPLKTERQLTQFKSTDD